MKGVQKNALEWTVFGVSAALLLAVVALLLYAHFTATDGPPQLTVRLADVRPQGDHHTVKVEVQNQGHTTAEEVHVEVVLSTDRGEERSTLEFPFVPNGAKRVGWAAFRTAPSTGRLHVRVLGYREP